MQNSEDALSIDIENLEEPDNYEINVSSDVGKTWLYEYIGTLFPNLVSHISIGYNKNENLGLMTSTSGV